MSVQTNLALSRDAIGPKPIILKENFVQIVGTQDVFGSFHYKLNFLQKY